MSDEIFFICCANLTIYHLQPAHFHHVFGQDESVTVQQNGVIRSAFQNPEQGGMTCSNDEGGIMLMRED